MILLLFGLSAANAALNVVATYPYIGSLTKTIGGNAVEVKTLAQGNWDPHFVVPKPSLITKVRNADLLIQNGGELEIGWLPPLLERASNSRLNQREHLLDLSTTVAMIDVPKSLSRAGGDIHPGGNPHFHLNPANIPVLADAITKFLIHNDPKNQNLYQANLSAFKKRWALKLREWDQKMAPLSGKSVIQYHAVFNYFLQRYKIHTLDTIEPFPGISPSASHTLKLIKEIKEEKPIGILHDVYHPTKSASYLHEKTGIALIVLPHDVESMKNTDDLEALFDMLCGLLS